MLVHVPSVLAAEALTLVNARLAAASWSDGKRTAGPQSGAVKDNLQLAEDSPEARALGDMVLAALDLSALFWSAALPARVYPPLFNKYESGMGFGSHIDNAIRKVPGTRGRIRTDLSATLFLSPPDSYDGGELVIEENFGTRQVKLAAGDMVLYPATSRHHVRPVTRGARLASFFWIQSMVRDDSERGLLFELDQSVQALAAIHGANDPEVLRLTGLYHNLVRKWGGAMTALLSAGESWRVAALTMMGPDELKAALGGENAAAWISAAAVCGIAEAQLRLGRMRLEGEGVAQDRAAAFSHFCDAAAQGNIQAHNMLGRCHENGWGTKVDYATAALEYGVAAAAGLDWAQYNLGHMLLSGSGVARNEAAAFESYGKAAAQGHVRAMNLVGRCHEQGWGTAQDKRKACLWYRRSARGGYFRGAYNYATLLAESGHLQSARLWFGRAIATAPEPSRGNMIEALRKKDRSAYP